ATIFGCLHLIPTWTSHFPSYHESNLWQVSAFVITVQRLLMLSVRILWDGRHSGVHEILFTIVTFCGGLSYAISRIILIVLTFTSLQSLPPAAYQNVAWTTFIPHF
ncbi:hypothetical protein P691DRAFT_674730, partial [Macrolepiota fuliginosa MF-IS2]